MAEAGRVGWSIIRSVVQTQNIKRNVKIIVEFVPGIGTFDFVGFGSGLVLREKKITVPVLVRQILKLRFQF